MDPTTYIEENTRSRERLYEVTQRLSDHDLNRKLSNGWTVAAALLHLAFWDRYLLAEIEGWERHGYTATASNVDAINDTIEFLALSYPPRMTILLAQSAADMIDRKVEALSPDLRSVLEESGRPRLLRRNLHRTEHLDQIEKAISY